MTKRKTKRRAERLFGNLSEMMASDTEGCDSQSSVEGYCSGTDQISSSFFSTTVREAKTSGENPRMKKFRFQLLHQWLIQNFEPCRVADIGGGKGLLTYMLQRSGWEATVIDPVYQPLPEKYKDIALNKRIKIPPDEKVPHINKAFEPQLAQHFDMLIGMHAHACNVKIIDAAAKFHLRFVLLPCCIIDEPIYPAPNVHWLECLADYAIQKGVSLRPFRLNFRGQNIGFYAEGHSHGRSHGEREQAGGRALSC